MIMERFINYDFEFFILEENWGNCEDLFEREFVS